MLVGVPRVGVLVDVYVGVPGSAPPPGAVAEIEVSPLHDVYLLAVASVTCAVRSRPPPRARYHRGDAIERNGLLRATLPANLD